MCFTHAAFCLVCGRSLSMCCVTILKWLLGTSSSLNAIIYEAINDAYIRVMISVYCKRHFTFIWFTSFYPDFDKSLFLCAVRLLTSSFSVYLPLCGSPAPPHLRPHQRTHSLILLSCFVNGPVQPTNGRIWATVENFFLVFFFGLFKLLCWLQIKLHWLQVFVCRSLLKYPLIQ